MTVVALLVIAAVVMLLLGAGAVALVLLVLLPMLSKRPSPQKTNAQNSLVENREAE